MKEKVPNKVFVDADACFLLADDPFIHLQKKILEKVLRALFMAIMVISFVTLNIFISRTSHTMSFMNSIITFSR